MTSTFSQIMQQPIQTTANGALSLNTTKSMLLDLFYNLCRGIDKDRLIELLNKSWADDKLDTLKIIFQARDCRGGKGEKELFKTCLVWLAENHADDLRDNLKHIHFYGRWDDLFALIKTELRQFVIEFYCEQLLTDLENMGKGELVSLCAKWAPTEGLKLDKKFKIVKLLCKELKCSRKDYRKKYIVPLRKYLKIVEKFMCSSEWDAINYSSVPSLAMKRLKKAFCKNDKERFEDWTQKLQEGTVKVNAKQLFPHELVQECYGRSESDVVTEEQWKVLEKEVGKMGKLSDSLVLSDVSGSMQGTPMMVSIALGILISGATEGVFKNLVLTFSTHPTFFELKSDTLQGKVNEMQGMHWGGSTDLSKAFKLILNRAVTFKLPNEDMPKRLFIISDMQFDQADYNFMTNFENIKLMYQKAGYTMPQIVFWNVNGTYKDCPVDKDEKNTVLISGFSPSILKYLLQHGDIPTPYYLMKLILDDERYDRIRLH